MGLSIANNIASLNAQNNLNKTNLNLSKSLERLSTGFKINRGADGPAALVISEQQRAQISGLRTAIDNTNKSVALVQTAEGALNEVSNLLTKIRSLAVDSANSGVNDSNALAANQSEITNALSTIDRIGTNTQFGTRKLFDGTAGLTGAASAGAAGTATLLKVSSSAVVGNNAVAITTAAERAEVGATTAGPVIGATLGADETVTINGVNVSLLATDTATDIENKIDALSGQTGVFASISGTNTLELRTTNFGSAATITASSNLGTSGVLSAASVTDSGLDIVGSVGGVTATGSGNTLSANGVTVSIAEATAGSTASLTGDLGQITVGDNSLSFQIGANAGQTVKFGFEEVSSDKIGVGVAGSTFASLSAIDITTATGAQDAIKVIDQAVNDIATLRGRLGAFQQNTLESNTSNLRAALENTTAAESVIRDTDFASEIADFTRAQVQLQAGASVLGNANQIPQLVASLLQG